MRLFLFLFLEIRVYIKLFCQQKEKKTIHKRNIAEKLKYWKEVITIIFK